MDRDDDPVLEIDHEPALEIESIARSGAANQFGKYYSLGCIGRGGMADVFCAEDQQLAFGGGLSNRAQ